MCCHLGCRSLDHPLGKLIFLKMYEGDGSINEMRDLCLQRLLVEDSCVQIFEAKTFRFSEF